jgi:hypothetical protein
VDASLSGGCALCSMVWQLQVVRASVILLFAVLVARGMPLQLCCHTPTSNNNKSIPSEKITPVIALRSAEIHQDQLSAREGFW